MGSRGRDRKAAIMDWQRKQLEWLRELSLDTSDIILRYSDYGWLAKIVSGAFVLYGAYANNPTDAVGTLYRSREWTVDAIERDLAKSE